MTAVAEQIVVLNVQPNYVWGKTMAISATHLRALGIESPQSMFVPRAQYWNLRHLPPQSLAKVARTELVK